MLTPVIPSAVLGSSSIANPTVITTAAPHGFVSGETYGLAGHAGSTPAINGSHVVTVLSPTTFSIPLAVTVAGTGGTATRELALEPVSLDEARAYLQLPDDLVDQDDAIEGWIREGRQLVEKATGLALSFGETWDYVIDQFPSRWSHVAIPLPIGPVLSVVSVTSYDDDDVATALDAGQYVAFLGDEGGIVLREGGAWPTDVRVLRAGVIRFTAGYASVAAVPEPLKGMIKLLVKRRYDGLEADGVDWNEIGAYLPVAV